jgi:ATP-binding cassette, subfamily B (MDR/TAP), member 7
MLNAVFANIGQRAIRRIARDTFTQLLNLDLKFHLSRQTGGLTRAIDRGTKYFFSLSLGAVGLMQVQQRNHLPSASHSLPPGTHFLGDIDGLWYFGELVSASYGALAANSVTLCTKTYKFGWDFAAVTVGTLILYTWFTVRTTSWRFELLLSLDLAVI